MKLLGFVIVLLGLICPMQVSAFMSHHMEEMHHAVSSDETLSKNSMESMDCSMNGCFKSRQKNSLANNLTDASHGKLKAPAYSSLHKDPLPELAYAGFIDSGQSIDAGLSQRVSSTILRI